MEFAICASGSLSTLQVVFVGRETCNKRKSEMNDTGTTTRTVAEIEAELRAAREAEDKQRRAAEAEKQRQAKKAEIATTNAYMEELAAKLTEAGVTCGPSTYPRPLRKRGANTEQAQETRQS